MPAVHHKFTFPDPYSARRFVWKVVQEIEKYGMPWVPLFVEDTVVHVIDADHQAAKLAQLAKESSATHLKVVRVPYPSDPSME